jgi:NADP-dependent 3-hydroxy acid dehydrogenase YdfG
MTKTLFITGASSGIGAATARKASEAGWNVALFARSEDKLKEVADGCASALVLPGDATSPTDLAGAVERAVQEFGGIDAAFANAGRGLKSSGKGAPEEDDVRGMVDLNILGVLWTVGAVLPELKKSKGTLVMTGSAAGKRHIPGSIYGATKWFVHGYAGNMAEEMREWGGRCTVVAPGMVDTPFFESGKPDKLKPEDVADAVMLAIEADPRAAVREVYLMPQST